MAQFVKDKSFVASHLAPKPLKFKARSGKTVSFDATDGTKGSGFYVAPSSGNPVTIVMVHEWWGLNDYIRRQAETLHTETGYGVLAVDMYDGKLATSPQEAGKLMSGINAAHAGALVKGAVTTLRKGTLGAKASKIGSVGWCFGGGWSFQTALQNGSNVGACVMYYGMPETDPAALAPLKAPVLFIYGTKDKWINSDVAAKFEAAMKTAKKSVTVKAYDEDHAFANPSNPKYSKVDADDAWARTIAFFKAHL